MFFSTRESSPNLYLLSLKCFLSWQVPLPACAQLKPMKTKDKHTPTHADAFQSHFCSWRSHNYEIYIQNTNNVCQRTHCPMLPVIEAIWFILAATASSPIICYPCHTAICSITLSFQCPHHHPQGCEPREDKALLVHYTTNYLNTSWHVLWKYGRNSVTTVEWMDEYLQWLH